MLTTLPPKTKLAKISLTVEILPSSQSGSTFELLVEEGYSAADVVRELVLRCRRQTE